ncbi:MAG: hypothetical protein AB2L26_10025 [Ignavibacteria bacterium]
MHIHRIPHRANILKKDLKSEVVKNSSLVKVEIRGKSEVLNLKELYSYLGINKLDRTYRSIASLEKMKVQGSSVSIDGRRDARGHIGKRRNYYSDC